MARPRPINVLQVLGGVILAATATVPGLFLAGHPRTPPLAIVCMLFTAAAGGLLAGAMIAPSHRIAGAIGGMIAGPLSLLVVAFYVHGRVSAFRAEVVLVSLAATLPGLGVYFLLRLLTDAIFPPSRRRDFDDDFDDDEFDEDDRPRRRRSRRDEPFDEDYDDDRPRRRRSRRDEPFDEDYDDDRPRRRRSRREEPYDDDDDRPPRRRRRDDYDE